MKVWSWASKTHKDPDHSSSASSKSAIWAFKTLDGSMHASVNKTLWKQASQMSNRQTPPVNKSWIQVDAFLKKKHHGSTNCPESTCKPAVISDLSATPCLCAALISSTYSSTDLHVYFLPGSYPSSSQNRTLSHKAPCHPTQYAGAGLPSFLSFKLSGSPEASE